LKKRIHVIVGIFSGLIILVSASLIILYQPDIPVAGLIEHYAQSPSKFITVMDMPVHYRDEGDPSDSIPLVLLHGTSSSLHTWDSCTSAWATGHRVVRMDLPGFGLTGPNPAGDYSIDMYLKFLESFLQQQNIEQCYLAGNSLGGLIAVYYAAAFPDKVKKLILLDPAGYPIKNAKGSLGFTLAKIPVLNKILTIATPRSIIRKSLEDVYGNKTLVTDELVEQYHDLTCRAGNRQALLVRLTMDQKGDTTVISKVPMPTLIVWGAEDQLIPINNAYKFQRDLPMDTLVVFPGVGHVPMEESPELVIPLVSKFIHKN
jgi:pimeloyl-ACP methyl ester carboxylesterase